MEKIRDKTIDSLKGLTIIIVVLRHVMQGGASDSDTVIIGNMMMAVEMPMFMILSGYFSAKSYRQQSINFSQLKSRLVKITISYLIPFLSFFFIFKVLILRQYTGTTFSLIIALANDITISLWFLFVVWVLALILTTASFFTGALLKNGSSELLKLIILLIMYVGMLFPWLVFAVNDNLNFLGGKLILYYSIFYFIGYLIKCFKNEILSNSLLRMSRDVLFAISLFIFALITINITLLNIPDNLWGIFIRFIVAICGMYNIVYIIYTYKDKINATVLPNLGKYTLEIYYVHSLFIRLMNIDNNFPLFTIRGFLNSSILLVMLSLFTYLSIVILKVTKITDLLIFGKVDENNKENIINIYEDMII